MVLRQDCSIRNVTVGVAACIADYGLAFIEDDKLDALSAALLVFLNTAGIPTHVPEPTIPTPGNSK
ncbi:hypothetical protein [Actinoplanes sp. NPDC020271]|uniref:hypothetical protein n=1 Tax=Actinoplanes sp. NPDC020271 TaxID=3363896 RepID=UPI00378B9718